MILAYQRIRLTRAPEQALQPPVGGMQRMGTVPVITCKAQIRDLCLQPAPAENPQVAAGDLVIGGTKPPADALWPGTGNADA